MSPFGETKSKAIKVYAQSGQYHTIVEGRGSLHDIRVMPLT